MILHLLSILGIIVGFIGMFVGVISLADAQGRAWKYAWYGVIGVIVASVSLLQLIFIDQAVNLTNDIILMIGFMLMALGLYQTFNSSPDRVALHYWLFPLGAILFIACATLRLIEVLT